MLAVLFFVVYCISAKCLFCMCERVRLRRFFSVSPRVNASHVVVYGLFLCVATDLYAVVFEVFLFVQTYYMLLVSVCFSFANVLYAVAF